MGRSAPGLVAVLLLVACGAVPGTGASGSRTASPAPPSPSPNAVLAASDCTSSTASPNSTTTKPLGMDSITLSIPVGWSDHTNEVSGAPALLYIQAPMSYGADNASFLLVSVPIGRVASSSHEQSLEDASGHAPPGSAISVNDCPIA